MKIRPLGKPLSGISGFSTEAAASTSQSSASQAQNRAPANEDAAKVDVGGSQKSGGSDRASYVASLKQQVQEGSYSVDSTKVAEAIYKDLF